MPTYLYRCSEGCKLEVEQRITAKALRTCPRCKANGKKGRLSRIPGCTNFILSGAGWPGKDLKGAK